MSALGSQGPIWSWSALLLPPSHLTQDQTEMIRECGGKRGSTLFLSRADTPAGSRRMAVAQAPRAPFTQGEATRRRTSLSTTSRPNRRNGFRGLAGDTGPSSSFFFSSICKLRWTCRPRSHLQASSASFAFTSENSFFFLPSFFIFSLRQSVSSSFSFRLVGISANHFFEGRKH